MKTSTPIDRPIGIFRRLERCAAWSAVLVALPAAALGFLAPHLGGEDPGLRGLPGYVAELVGVGWRMGGWLALALAVLSALRRHRLPALLLALVALAIGVTEFQGRWSVDSFTARRATPALRVASVNLAAWNKDDPSMEASLRELGADVIVLSEYSRAWASKLERWFSDDYPYRFVAPPLAENSSQPARERDEQRQAVWSRLEAAAPHEVFTYRPYPAQIRLPLVWDGRELALYAIHSRVPTPRWAYDQSFKHRRSILQWLRKEELPMILAGDFNSTPRSAYFQRVRELGLTSASEALLGYAPVTWPMKPWRPELFCIAIDHILASDELEPVHFEVRPRTKSDHAPIVAEYVWR